ncbi:MAG: membrane protein YqaA with SNARE-associated domain [Acidimicrobiales bacterium]|jgi:membrane protein YqaA with SNARE-associated domain
MSFFGVHAHKKTTDVVAKHGAKWLKSKHATWILAMISFAESLFAPILIDPFLIALIIATPKKWKLYTIVSIIASIMGGIVAYILGFLFFETLGIKIIEFYSLQGTFESISQNLDKSGFAFVLVGAFTPIPYKIVAIASGVLHISFVTFVVASTFGRVLRLGLVGVATQAVGPRALPVVRRNLYTIAAIAGILLLGYIAWQLL